MLPDGRYAVPIRDGLRIISVNTVMRYVNPNDAWLFGKRMLSLRLNHTTWEKFGFVEDDNSVTFFKTLRGWTEEHQRKIREAVSYIAANTEECFRAYERFAEEQEQLKKEKKHGS